MSTIVLINLFIYYIYDLDIICIYNFIFYYIL
jgi:hypothetical protein